MRHNSLSHQKNQISRKLREQLKKKKLQKSVEPIIGNSTNEQETDSEDESHNKIDIDEDQRRIYLFGDIDLQASFAIALAIDHLNRQNKEEITVVINSGGGSCHDMFAIVDCMMLSKAPIKTIGTGIIASAATLIIAAGAPGRRFLTKNCMVMTHELQWGHFTSLESLKDILHTGYTMEDKYTKLMSKFCNRTVSEIKKYIVGKDHWMDAQQAIENLGLADKIATKKDI